MQAERGIETGALEVGRYENLTGFFIGFLERHGQLTEALRNSIEHLAPVRTSEHGPASDYYDDSLRELVAQTSEWVLERFDYSFPP